MANEKFIIPEYKIELLSKSKKPINSFEHINSINELSKKKDDHFITKKIKKNLKNKDKDKDKVKKAKNKKTIRTLWEEEEKRFKLDLLSEYLLMQNNFYSFFRLDTNFFQILQHP